MYVYNTLLLISKKKCIQGGQSSEHERAGADARRARAGFESKSAQKGTQRRQSRALPNGSSDGQ